MTAKNFTVAGWIYRTRGGSPVTTFINEAVKVGQYFAMSRSFTYIPACLRTARSPPNRFHLFSPTCTCIFAAFHAALPYFITLESTSYDGKTSPNRAFRSKSTFFLNALLLYIEKKKKLYTIVKCWLKRNPKKGKFIGASSSRSN